MFARYFCEKKIDTSVRKTGTRKEKNVHSQPVRQTVIGISPIRTRQTIRYRVTAILRRPQNILTRTWQTERDIKNFLKSFVSMQPTVVLENYFF